MRNLTLADALFPVDPPPLARLALLATGLEGKEGE